jgi:hypothetical protein
MSQISKRLQKLEYQRGSRHLTHEECLAVLDGSFAEEGLTQDEYIAKHGGWPDLGSMYSADELMEFAK